MELACVMLSLLALFLLCAFLTLRCRLHSALAPLTALAVLVFWLTMFGMAGCLLAGMRLALALCTAAGVLAFRPRPGLADALRRLFTPGAALFWTGTLFFAVYFFIRQPMAIGFDELNLWATAVKVTVTDDALYTTAALGVPWTVTQNPGLPLLSYFFSFFGSYADWKIYFAYDALTFAVYAAVLGTLPWRRYRLWVPLAAALWCVPWFFTVYYRVIYLNTMYMTSYGDVPAGLVMGGAVALWLALRRGGGPRWAVLPVLALAANIKANTFVLSLVAAGLVAVDAWLFAGRPFTKGMVRRTGFALACMAAPMSIYYLWNLRYVGRITAQNAASGGMGDTTPSLVQVVVNGVAMLLGRPASGFYAEREQQFRAAVEAMGTQFWTPAGTLSMLGHGAVLAALFLGLALAACLLAGRGAWLRPACSAVCCVLCFAGYNLVLALSYGFIFKPDQAAGLVDYNRYIYCYYIGWFLIALAWLVEMLDRPQAEHGHGRWRAAMPLASELLVLLMAGGMLLRCHQMVLPQLSVLGFSETEFADRHRDHAQAEAVSAALTPQDRVFFVSQGDNGQNWFAAEFDFYPIQVDYSGTLERIETADGPYGGGGGGTFGPPELWESQTGARWRYYTPYTTPQFDELVRQSGCTVLYLQRIDELFVQSYASLFTDGLQAALTGQTPLYRVTDEGFAPQPLPQEVTPE